MKGRNVLVAAAVSAAATVGAVAVITNVGATSPPSSHPPGEDDDRDDHDGRSPSAGKWGVINRNTIGSPVAELRSGPFTPALGPVAASGPPIGKGSLNISVGGSTEKAAYGNEVDFFGVDLLGVNAVGFHVFQVGENLTQGPAAMPNIAIEIDPNVSAAASNFSTLTFVPRVTGPGWSGFIDATTTGLWGGTGDAFAGTPCDLQGSLCSWADLKAQLDDGGDAPVILSVSINKGRDQEWHGAVDGLQVGTTVYNFEETGVVATPAA